MKNRSLEAARKRMTVLTYAALILGAILMIFPFVWMILTSSKTCLLYTSPSPRD